MSNLLQEANAQGEAQLAALRAQRAAESQAMHSLVVKGLTERADEAGVVRSTDSADVHAEAYRQVTGEVPMITAGMQPPAEQAAPTEPQEQ